MLTFSQMSLFILDRGFFSSSNFVTKFRTICCALPWSPSLSPAWVEAPHMCASCSHVCISTSLEHLDGVSSSFRAEASEGVPRPRPVRHQQTCSTVLHAHSASNLSSNAATKRCHICHPSCLLSPGKSKRHYCNPGG